MMNRNKLIIASLLWIGSFTAAFAQQDTWSLDECIDYALQENIQVRQAELTINQSELYTEQAKAAKLPNLSASVNQSFSWNKSLNSDGTSFGSYGNNNSTDYGVSSSTVLYNGNALNNSVKQAELNLKTNEFNTAAIKESVELSILDAYLQVLFARESVNNAQNQIEATASELQLAEERLNLGLIAQSDLLQIKSQLASEKLTLASSRTTLGIARLNLMQLMNMPATDDFQVESPDLSEVLNKDLQPDATSVYQQSLEIRPQIKQVEIASESAKLDEKIAKAAYLPTLSLNAGMSTGYSNSLSGFNYTEQLKNQVTPSVGLTLSIPIFQRKTAKTSVGLAQIAINDARLAEQDTKNELRKNVEQATLDVQTAQFEYEANNENYDSTDESMKVATEKFSLGLMNSVDYLYEKNQMITAESQLLQAKYQLIFSYKILDFYKGIPITL